jgi:CHRD domain
VIGLTLTVATADEGTSRFAASLSGFNEVPPILTNGTGSFHATVHGNSLTYTETFSNLTSPVTQSHIHFAQRGVNGGVFLFLCSNLVNPPAGTPACPAGGGTVTRTVTAADFVAVTAQNVPAGNFSNALRILRSGDAYVNVHTMNFLGGEIRGQVNSGDN